MNATDIPPMPESGRAAPAFRLPDQDGKQHALEDFRGSWVLLYFYPKDDTPGCTAEACGFRDVFSQLKRRECAVLGISTDSVASHRAFADKYGLPFTLLADPEGQTTMAYGARRWKSFMGKTALGTIRCSFLIDPDGVVRKAYPKVTPEEHAKELLADLDAMKGNEG